MNALCAVEQTGRGNQQSIGFKMSFVSQALLFLVIIFISLVARKQIARYGRRPRWPIAKPLSGLLQDAKTTKKRKNPVDPLQSTGLITVSEAMQNHKDLYHRLQNLEKYPAIITQGRDLLISFFAEALAKDHSDSDESILSLEEFDPDALAKFLRAKDHMITVRWEHYLSRRQAGMPREMFKNHEHAKWWLKQSAPVKYVDGAWLRHIHKISTPFALRGITKNAWQIFSEELGDGDLSKNHVHIYRELMNQIDSGLPNGDSAEFISPDHQLDTPQVWKAAVAQLLISLNPHEFLPEILGFNMHFEMLTWDTMRAIKELKELKLNEYYFLLHVSIDNADSGHTAMAMQVVIDYVRHIQETEGASVAQQVWRRVQTGFILSENLASSPGDLVGGGDYLDDVYLDNNEVGINKIFKAKAVVAHRLHCSSRVKIQNKALVEWLEPEAFQSRRWQKDFLDALAETRPWIRKGESNKSKLVAELCWNGKMFGSFTQAEVQTLARWIDSLAYRIPDAKHYWTFVNRNEISSEAAFRDQDIRVNYPVFPVAKKFDYQQETAIMALDSTLLNIGSPRVGRFLASWFTHTCLLENLSTTPFKTANWPTSAVIRVLRAQYGFAPEGTGVAGMDELRRTACVSLIDIGLEMTQRFGLPEPRGLTDVLVGDDSEFAISMLNLSMRPIENREILLGMAWAFMHLHEAVANSTCTEFLLEKTKIVLANMAQRERLGLQVCLDELRRDRVQYSRWCRGFEIARSEIVELFG